jgi:hypothetical protein
MDKTELLEALEDERQELMEMLEDLPNESMLVAGVNGTWSIKDILIHLTHWEGQIVTLLFQASQGVEKPSTAHFGKEKVDDLNQRWYEAGKERSLDLAWQDWVGVRKQTIRRVSEFSDQDLNDPKRYSWLKGTPLWQWIATDTYEHEEEHGDAIREWLEKRDSAASN